MSGARLFVAADLPANVRDELFVWRELLASEQDEALRWIDREALHLTLCFLGPRPEAEMASIAAAVLACAAPAPGLVLGEALWLPPRRPRVLAAAVTDERGALAALQRRVSEALVARGWYEPERRPFRAHVTVARVRRGAVAPALAERSGNEGLRFAAQALTLYRSRTGPGGARYEVLARAEL